jgi:HEAT repeat protein
VPGDRGNAVRAFAVPEPSLTKSPPSTSRVDSDPSTDEAGVGNREALVLALGDADANVRVDAVSDLGLSSDTQAESLLAITAMQDPAPAVRVEALYALESLRAESQLAAFRHALDDPDADVRKAVIGALEELGGYASTEILRAALNDRDAAVRAAAAEALADSEPPNDAERGQPR